MIMIICSVHRLFSLMLNPMHTAMDRYVRVESRVKQLSNPDREQGPRLQAVVHGLQVGEQGQLFLCCYMF